MNNSTDIAEKIQAAELALINRDLRIKAHLSTMGGEMNRLRGSSTLKLVMVALGVLAGPLLQGRKLGSAAAVNTVEAAPTGWWGKVFRLASIAAPFALRAASPVRTLILGTVGSFVWKLIKRRK